MNLLVSFVVLALLVVDAQYLFTRKCSNNYFECDNGQCVSKQYWCQRYGKNVCYDRSDQRNCGLYPKCATDQIACDAKKTCFPLKWACDGYEDCSDGSDEKECLDGYRIKDKLKAAKQQARAWLLKQRRTNWGWEGDTHRAILALYLSNVEQFHPGDFDSKLMMKQLEIQLSKTILKGHPIPMHEMALYIHSLLSICVDPRTFNYHDLVQKLQQSLDKSDTFNPFIALALCNANVTLSEENILKLFKILFPEHASDWLEPQAFAVMTALCIKNRSGKVLAEENLQINTTGSVINTNFSDAGLILRSRIKSAQRSDGSFGSLYTTALVLQTFQAIGDNGDGWNKTKAFQYLLTEQKNDGSFGDDILSTYLILPILNEKSLFDLGHVNCTSDTSQIRNLTVREELDSRNSISQKVTYSVIVGVAKEIQFSTTFTVPINTTFYDVMRLAEELDPRYRFRYISYDWGIYVYSIFGIVNDPESEQYWLLFQLKGKSYQLERKGPDRLITESNGEYIFWHRDIRHFIVN